jgi:hypothetical protein
VAEIYRGLPSGERVKGRDIFRGLYSAVGPNFLSALTTWLGLRLGVDELYTALPTNRLSPSTRRADGHRTVEAK